MEVHRRSVRPSVGRQTHPAAAVGAVREADGVFEVRAPGEGQLEEARHGIAAPAVHRPHSERGRRELRAAQVRHGQVRLQEVLQRGGGQRAAVLVPVGAQHLGQHRRRHLDHQVSRWGGARAVSIVSK